MVLFEFLLLDPQFFLLLSITVLILVKSFSLKLDSDLDLVHLIPKLIHFLGKLSLSHYLL